MHYDDNASFNQIRNAPYTPYEVGPKLALWLDANDTATIINDDGNVSEWRDKSGNNLHLTQDTNASKPFTGGHTQNGSNVVSFDGDDFLQRGFSNILNFSQTWFIVARVDSGGIDNNGDSLLSYGFAGEGRWELRSQNQNSFNSKIAKNSSWLPTITQTVSLDNYHLFTLTADRNNSTFSN